MQVITERPEWLKESIALAIDAHKERIDLAVNGSEVDYEGLYSSLSKLEAELLNLLADKDEVEKILDKLFVDGLEAEL